MTDDSQSEKRLSIRRYWLLLAVETAGESIILWFGLPAYRRLILDQIYESGPTAEALTGAVIGVVLVQSGYWANGPLKLRFYARHHVLLGHVALFLGRLNFIFVSGMFAAVFIVGFDSVHLTLGVTALLLLVLFSAYCYTRELERLGRGLGV
jgi:hypothetical protein